jgi:hypothetical protein
MVFDVPFLIMCFIRFVVIARLVSIGASRWFAVLILIPIINLFFMLFLLLYPARSASDVRPEAVGQ